MMPPNYTQKPFNKPIQNKPTSPYPPKPGMPQAGGAGGPAYGTNSSQTGQNFQAQKPRFQPLGGQQAQGGAQGAQNMYAPQQGAIQGQQGTMATPRPMAPQAGQGQQAQAQGMQGQGQQGIMAPPGGPPGFKDPRIQNPGQGGFQAPNGMFTPGEGGLDNPMNNPTPSQPYAFQGQNQMYQDAFGSMNPHSQQYRGPSGNWNIGGSQGAQALADPMQQFLSQNVMSQQRPVNMGQPALQKPRFSETQQNPQEAASGAESEAPQSQEPQKKKRYVQGADGQMRAVYGDEPAQDGMNQFLQMQQARMRQMNIGGYGYKPGMTHWK